jgi:stage III sporulation protein SpoIIIAA
MKHFQHTERYQHGDGRKSGFVVCVRLHRVQFSGQRSRKANLMTVSDLTGADSDVSIRVVLTKRSLITTLQECGPSVVCCYIVIRRLKKRYVRNTAVRL